MRIALLVTTGLWRTALGAGSLLVALRSPAPAQIAGPAGPVAELRGDVVVGDRGVSQLAAGIQVPSGTYVRVAVIGGIGAAWQRGEAGRSARLEAQARFHLDPWRESAIGGYGLGGLAATWDSFERWEPRLVLGAGVELPGARGRGWAVEAALAGGLRLSVMLRGALPDRR